MKKLPLGGYYKDEYNVLPHRRHCQISYATGRPLLAIISFDGAAAAIAPIDDAVEHHILIKKSGLPANIDEVFRIVINKEGADWTFICPSDYKQIPDKRRRIAAFIRTASL
ncbi:MAG: hypothetical protein ACLR23_01045 [Clostridia bacterium]